MGKHVEILARLGIAAVLSMAALEPAQAGGFIVRSHSAAGFGMSLAGIAAGGGPLSSAFWNPATLADVETLRFEGVATGIFPSIEIHPDAATNGLIGLVGGTTRESVEIGESALVPAMFAAYPLNERVTFALATTSPFGLSTSAPRNWPGQIYSRRSEIFSVNVNPMVSYRLNDWIAIGAGPQIEYFRAELSQAVAPMPDAPDAALEADNVGIGFNAGVQIRPWEGTRIGLGYRSSIAHSLEGHLEQPGARLAAKAGLDTPDVVSLGLRQSVSERLRLLATVEWNNWSRLGKLPVRGQGGGPPLTVLHLDYEDGWLYSLGAEFDASERLTVRAGLGYEVSPLSGETRDTRLPEVDQFIVSAGFSYAHSERVSLDLGYTQSIGLGDGAIDIGPGNDRYLGLPFSGDSDLDVSIVSAALNIAFGGR